MGGRVSADVYRHVRTLRPQHHDHITVSSGVSADMYRHVRTLRPQHRDHITSKGVPLLTGKETNALSQYANAKHTVSIGQHDVRKVDMKSFKRTLQRESAIQHSKVALFAHRTHYSHAVWLHLPHDKAQGYAGGGGGRRTIVRQIALQVTIKHLRFLP